MERRDAAESQTKNAQTRSAIPQDGTDAARQRSFSVSRSFVVLMVSSGVLLVGMCASILADDDDQAAFTSWFRIDQTRYVARLTTATLAKSPPWSEDAENPPLSARKAMRLAHKEKERLTANARFKALWMFEDARLRSVADLRDCKDRWFWVITYTESHAVSSGPPIRLPIFVTMDGKVVKARRTTQAP
jgi:hypothetical protein